MGLISLMVEAWGEKKVPILWVLIALMATFLAHEWADSHYLPIDVAKASELDLKNQITALANTITENRQLTEAHIRDYNLNENRKAIELVRDQQFELQQYKALNGSNDLLVQREDRLERKLEILQEQRTCLLNTKDNNYADCED